MTPATVADAYWMLRQAVEVPDPVIFLEHKFLYPNQLLYPGNGRQGYPLKRIPF